MGEAEATAMAAAVASKSRFVVGSHVWVEDPDEAWMDGLVEEINGDELVINCTSGKKVTANVSSAYPKDTESPRGGVEDMTRLAYLHEPGVLQNLKSRYGLNEIYTYTGNILIAVNPFQRLPHLYNNHMMGIYKGAEFGELSPHPFAIADRSYRLMINDRISQAILVSGESGAGKTESTKMLMQYLAYMGGKAQAEGRSVQQQILESNPVLEAFGNAKTVRNNNSSRFGKFVEIQFDENGKISGAAIRTYLLERSRVCQISDPERNYHCFYMLCAAPPEDCKKYKLGDARSFHYLNQSNCIALDGLDDSKEYMETRRAMGIVGISSDEQDAIFRVVASILHLGNVEFAEGSEADSSVPKDEKSQFHLKTAAELFMCDEKGLEESLCKRVMATRGESITKNLDPRAAALSRDALARIVYSRLFDWLVNKINSSIGQDPDSKILIGVLDIYGFESFLTNSFEQFCINLTNEKLQQHFNQHVFKMEQEEYTKEEIDWSYIQFVDNQEILDLIEKKPGGIIALLDETCMLRNSTHETFAEKLYQKFKDNPHFSKPKFSRSDFTIHHYAGNVVKVLQRNAYPFILQVTYQTDLFLDKNIDYAVNEHQVLLNASKCSFVSSLFPPCEESTKSTKFTSIGSSFKQQLQSLLETLSATEPHYIRCIKPNNVLKPAIFENTDVLQQLRCGGVLEAIRISCLGYPTRRTFYEFVNRFGILQPKVLGRSHDEVTASKMLLDKANLRGYQVIIRTRTTARRCYENLRREAGSLKIQTCYRMHHARKSYVDICSASTTIQSGLRGMGARIKLRFKRQTKAAVIIQLHCLFWCLQADMEEAKTQENKKLQLQLQELQLQLKDTKDLLKREHEAAKEASEKAAAVPEILADTARIDELTSENERLKILVSSFEEKLQKTEQKFEETEKAREELLNKATDAESQINELKNTMQSLQEKLANTEAENHVLRQQAMKARPDNMPLLNMHQKSVLSPLSLSLSLGLRHGLLVNLANGSVHSDEQESVDALINCVVENVGFSEGKPVAAITIYKCLLHWRIFETDKTNVFDRLIQIFGSAMQKQDNNADLAYWLSNSSSLLIILQKSLKPPGSSGTTPMKRPQTQPSFLGRMVFRASNITVDMDLVRQVEAKYPALLFKQQLTAFVEGLYGMIRDNVKKEISSVLSLVIQVTPSIESHPQAPRNAKAVLITDQDSYWQMIVNHLNDLLKILQENCVPTIFARKIFTQIFSFINAQLLNSNGEYVKQGLDELESWCTQAKPEHEQYAGSAWDELKHICQAVGFLASTYQGFQLIDTMPFCVGLQVIFKKFRISYDEIINDLCPVLSVQQIYKICTQYWDDKYNTESVSEEVLDEMKKLVNEGTGQQGAADSTFLLDEEISMPLSLEEIASSMDAKEFQNVSPPQELLDNAAFQFLRS
ncbi:Myosin-6 [Dichanthelium oligosanthes]|uniref:Myosin-6 n=1 Tax=Dichanthelium oligosanthes TaxID=888268 RepID=A0A1E5VYK5_9POAL|nr:Myosin-6 [Dichanthelium oligosanthes]